jgi:hypothetical protein
MKFHLHDSALNGDDRILMLIDRLVDRIADEVHRVEVPAADLLQDSEWYVQARPTRRKVLTSALAIPPRKSADDARGPHVKMIEVADMESAEVADRLAHTPLVVMVEDRESDGVLLEIIVEELGWVTLRTLWKIGQEVTPRAITIETSGGNDAIPQRVERAAGDATQEGRPLRCFVLCDSDVRWPGDDRDANKLRKVHNACTKHGVPHHFWRKRCSENYIPDEVFRVVRDDPRNLSHVERFSALLRRSPTQRDHFPVKDGLRPNEREQATVAGLFDVTEQADLELLEERLFASRRRPLKQLQEERRTAFTAEGLRRRDGLGELDSFLEALAKEL